jgi:thermitase
MSSNARPRRAPRPLRPRAEFLDDRTLLSLGAGLASGPVLAPAEIAPADRLLVKFRPGTTSADEAALLAATRTTLLSAFPDGPAIVAGGPGFDPSRALAEFQSSPLIVYAEPDATVSLASTSTSLPSVAPYYPTDPSFGQQWGLNTPNDVDIDAPEAWPVTTGSASTIVAVLDTGVDLKNPDLLNRLWVNPSASQGRTTVYGWNFVNNNGNVQDANGHGTHVTGVIAATGGNGQGVVGVNWHAQIMPLKILDATGSGSLDNAVRAVYFAADHGARVISASWGSSMPDQALDDAIHYADGKGVVFVTAAGNDGMNNDLVPTYPASYHTPNMLVVAALDQNGNLASFSDYGPTTVDLAAPGVNILSTYPTKLGGHAVLSGTSMATPFVAGVVSLVVGMHPSWTAEQLVQRVIASTKPLPGLAGKVASGGMVDAAQAVGVAGSGPYGDHYIVPPVVQKIPAKRVVLHSRTHPKVARKVLPRPVKRAEAGAADLLQPTTSRLALRQPLPIGNSSNRSLRRAR